MKEIENNAQSKKETNKNELSKSPKERNIYYNFRNDLKSYENPLILKKANKFELQESQSINIKKHRTNNNTNYNKNKNNLIYKHLKDKSSESSINISKKYLERTNKKINNLKKRYIFK